MLSAAAKPGNTSTPSASACGASQAHMAPSETMKLPLLCMPGGIGRLRWPVLLSSQNSSSTAGTQIGGGLSRQPGSSASSGCGSITAPDRICAPMVEAFSITHTLTSGLSCLSRIANDRPAGPAPTTTTSYSMISRSLIGRSGRFWLAGGVRAVAGGPGPSQRAIVRFRALCGNAWCSTACKRLTRAIDNRSRHQGDFMNQLPPISDRDQRRATLCQLLHWLAAGRVQPEGLAEVYLEAIERLNPQLNAYVGLSSGLLREQARAAQHRRRDGGLGRLDGLPVAIKDNFDVAG